MRVLLGIYILLIAFAAKADDRFYRVNTRSNEIKIMGYNLQNLFDSQHDEGKNDYEFLPKSSKWKKYCDPKIRPITNVFMSLSLMGGWEQACLDTNWSAKKVKQKIKRVKDALDLQGSYPDILALSEVENPNVVGKLAKALGYSDFYMTDSPDKRGIDLAVLFMEDKLTAIDYIEVEVEDSMYPTRNASAVHFRLADNLGGGVLGVYPVHWPSLRGPASARISAAKTVRKLVNAEKRKYNDEQYQAIILGDFNVSLERDKTDIIKDVLLDRGWSNQFFRVRKLAERAKHPHLDKMPQATYYYGAKDQWNYFDQILVTKSLKDGKGFDVEATSYRIHAPRKISQENDHGERIPFRYNHQTDEVRWVGYSDHYAVHVKLRYRAN